jgi:hypothetical protein
VSEPNSSQPSVRVLKIEECGDFWKGLLKPKIRLTGRWLEQAGFKPGNHVHVTCIAPGVIELRAPTSFPDENQQSANRSEHPI